MNIINKIEENIIAVSLFISVMLVFVNVILRKFFNNNTTWVEEVVRFMIIWITFIGSAACFRKSAHMGIDLIFSFVEGKVKKAVELFILSMSLIFVLLLLYFGIRLLLFAYNSGQITPALQIKTYLVYIGIPLGAFLSSLEIVGLIYKEVRTEAN